MKPTILTISDGNGVDTDFKKWPMLLKLLTLKTHNVLNYSVIGASNEMIFMQLSEAVKNNKLNFAVVQWTIPQRIDLVADSFWEDQARIDPVYHFNLINNNNKKWWVTSASTNIHIKEYHNKYIKDWQAVQRSQTYMIAAAELLKFYNIDFTFSLCYAFNFIDPQIDILNSYNWAWHAPNQGISEFRHTSKYLTYDYQKPQPHPLIGLEWIEQVLKPGCKCIDYSPTTYYNIEQSLLKNV
jgi:hypothetical protein